MKNKTFQALVMGNLMLILFHLDKENYLFWAVMECAWFVMFLVRMTLEIIQDFKSKKSQSL